MHHQSDEVQHNGTATTLPPPFADDTVDGKLAKSRSILFLGSSAIFLDPIRLSALPAEINESEENGESNAPPRAEASRQFELSYMPLNKGFSSIGGLRVILVEDRMVEGDNIAPDDSPNGLFGAAGHLEAHRQPEVRVLKEWDVIGEVWVKS